MNFHFFQVALFLFSLVCLANAQDSGTAQFGSIGSEGAHRDSSGATDRWKYLDSPPEIIGSDGLLLSYNSTGLFEKENRRNPVFYAKNKGIYQNSVRVWQANSSDSAKAGDYFCHPDIDVSEVGSELFSSVDGPYVKNRITLSLFSCADQLRSSSTPSIQTMVASGARFKDFRLKNPIIRLGDGRTIEGELGFLSPKIVVINFEFTSKKKIDEYKPIRFFYSVHANFKTSDSKPSLVYQPEVELGDFQAQLNILHDKYSHSAKGLPFNLRDSQSANAFDGHPSNLTWALDPGYDSEPLGRWSLNPGSKAEPIDSSKLTVLLLRLRDIENQIRTGEDSLRNAILKRGGYIDANMDLRRNDDLYWKYLERSLVVRDLRALGIPISQGNYLDIDSK